MAAVIPHVSQLQCSHCKSYVQQKHFQEPWACWNAGITVAEGDGRGCVPSRCIVRLFRNRRGGFCSQCFCPRTRDRSQGLEHLMGDRTSHGGQFAGEIFAFPPPGCFGLMTIVKNNPGESKRGTWGWFPGSAGAAGGNGLCLCDFFSAGSFTKPAKPASWTGLSPYISCWGGWVETS